MIRLNMMGLLFEAWVSKMAYLQTIHDTYRLIHGVQVDVNHIN